MSTKYITFGWSGEAQVVFGRLILQGKLVIDMVWYLNASVLIYLSFGNKYNTCIQWRHGYVSLTGYSSRNDNTECIGNSISSNKGSLTMSSATANQIQDDSYKTARTTRYVQMVF